MVLGNPLKGSFDPHKSHDLQVENSCLRLRIYFSADILKAMRKRNDIITASQKKTIGNLNFCAQQSCPSKIKDKEGPYKISRDRRKKELAGVGDCRSDRQTAVLMAMAFERMKRKYINRHSKDKCTRIEYHESPHTTDTQVRRGGKPHQLKEVNQRS